MNGSDGPRAETRRCVGELLRRVYEDGESLDDVMQRWPKDAEFESAYQAIEHWTVDADVRAKDERYARWQRQQIERIIARLMDGQSLDMEDSRFLKPHWIPSRRRERGAKNRGEH